MRTSMQLSPSFVNPLINRLDNHTHQSAQILVTQSFDVTAPSSSDFGQLTASKIETIVSASHFKTYGQHVWCRIEQINWA